jgi:serine kinase of HPr protein (carbohydrate metabolism regulator)
MKELPHTRLHASCVSIDGRGVLLVGPSGIGKSDVALRLIDAGAELVSDDQTDLREAEGTVIASPPPALAGLIEIRHAGLMRLPWSEAPVELYVELVAPEAEIDRLPESSLAFLLGQPVKSLKLRGAAASTPTVIRAVLRGVFDPL